MYNVKVKLTNKLFNFFIVFTVSIVTDILNCDSFLDYLI